MASVMLLNIIIHLNCTPSAFYITQTKLYIPNQMPTPMLCFNIKGSQQLKQTQPLLQHLSQLVSHRFPSRRQILPLHH